MPQDYKQMYKKMKVEREQYLIKSAKIASLTIDSNRIDPLAFSSVNQPKQIRTPYSDVGARCVKGLSSIISNLLNPPNLSSFKLDNSIKLELQPQEKNLLDALYVGIEKNINSFKDQNSYKAYQYQALISCCIHGQVATKISEEDGYMRFDLDSFVVSRHRGKLQFAIFEECIINDDGEEETQYIHVDYVTGVVSLQVGEKQPKIVTGEDASQYVISTMSVPVNENYSQSIIMDHYGVLNGINQSWKALEEAQEISSYNIQTYTGPPSISTKDLARIPTRSVIRVPSHDVLRWNGVGNEKLNAWQWVATLTTSREQQLLTNFGIGLLQRAGQLQTATEVRAIMQELLTLTGPLILVWSDTFSNPVLDAEIKVIDAKGRLDNALSTKGLAIPQDIKDQLMVPVVVSGVSSFARSEAAEQLVHGISTLLNSFAGSPEALAAVSGSIDFAQVTKRYLENIQVDTDGITKEYVPAQPAGQEPAQNVDQATLNAVANLPPELIANLPDEIRNGGPNVIANYLLSQNQGQGQ